MSLLNIDFLTRLSVAESWRKECAWKEACSVGRLLVIAQTPFLSKCFFLIIILVTARSSEGGFARGGAKWFWLTQEREGVVQKQDGRCAGHVSSDNEAVGIYVRDCGVRCRR